MNGLLGAGMMMSIGGAERRGKGGVVGAGGGGVGVGDEIGGVVTERVGAGVLGGFEARAGVEVDEVDSAADAQLREGGTFGAAEARRAAVTEVTGGRELGAREVPDRRFGGGVLPAERGISDAGGTSGGSDSSLIAVEKPKRSRGIVQR